MEELIPIIARHPEMIGWLLGHVAVLVVLRRVLDYANPRLVAYAQKTETKVDDRVAWVLVHVALGIDFVLRLVRAILPTGRMEPSPLADRDSDPPEAP
jgi:hypothetical protein